MPIACKYCIMTKGLKGSDLNDLPKTDDEFINHLEREHHLPVRRIGESKGEAMKRFKRENPEAGTDKCKCPKCTILREIEVLKILAVRGRKK